MSRTQKTQSMSKRHNKTDMQRSNQRINVHLSSRGEEPESFVCTISTENKRNKILDSTQDEPIDYATLIHMLKARNADRIFIKEMNLAIRAHRMPRGFLLEKEIQGLAVIKRNIDILSQSICRSSTDAMRADLKRIGSDMYGATEKYGKSFGR